MVTTLTLLGCLCGIGQVGGNLQWQLTPRLTRGQELVYRGTVRQHSVGRGVQFTKHWKLEAWALVQEMPDATAQMAFLTKLTEQPGTDRASLRLEQARMDSQGHLTPEGGARPAVPLDGPATWETGWILPVPPVPAQTGQPWTIDEPGQPGRKYTPGELENLETTTCLKVVADQQSDTWDRPRGDVPGWRRRDTVWMLPGLGVAYKVRREVEVREAAHRDVTFQIVTEYQLESRFVQPALALQDRCEDIRLARECAAKVAALAAQPGTAPRAYDVILARIDQQAKKAATPYREELLRVRAEAQLYRDGKRPAPPVEVAPRPGLAVGKKAPEFVIQDFANKATVTPRAWKGQPVLMVFYVPGAPTANQVLRYAQQLGADRPALIVAGFAIADDAAAVARTTAELGLTFPSFPGKALIQSYAAHETPWMVLLDAEGYVRGKWLGWGPEIPQTLEAELKRCLPGGK